MINKARNEHEINQAEYGHRMWLSRYSHREFQVVISGGRASWLVARRSAGHGLAMMTSAPTTSGYGPLQDRLPFELIIPIAIPAAGRELSGPCHEKHLATCPAFYSIAKCAG